MDRAEALAGARLDGPQLGRVGQRGEDSFARSYELAEQRAGQAAGQYALRLRPARTQRQFSGGRAAVRSAVGSEEHPQPAAQEGEVEDLPRTGDPA
jgi:hypothetical protein